MGREKNPQRALAVGLNALRRVAQQTPVRDAIARAAAQPIQAIIKVAALQGKQTILLGCSFPSHFQNMADLPALLEDTGRYQVILLCGFSRKSYRPAVPPNVPVFYRQFLRARPWLTPDLYVSPESSSSPIVPGAKRSVHMMHSIVGLDGVYSDDAFDGFKAIYCVGPHHVADFRRLASRRRGVRWTLIPGGYPKLDDQLAGRPIRRKQGQPVRVIYAPTFVYPVNEATASLRSHGEEIVARLVRDGYNVTFRPHPVSMTVASDRALIERIVETHKNVPGFTFDTSKDYGQSYEASDVMVTDLSGTGFTFAFAYERPALFFAPNAAAEAAHQGLHFERREDVGGVARSLEALSQSLAKVIGDPEGSTARIKTLRAEAVFHLGASSRNFVECVPQLLSGNHPREWVEVSAPETGNR